MHYSIYKNLNRRKQVTRLLEGIFVLVFAALLSAIQLDYYYDYVVRTKLSEIWSDMTAQRLRVASDLALTGDLPDTGTSAMYNRSAARTNIQPDNINIGFSTRQRAFNKRVSKQEPSLESKTSDRQASMQGPQEKPPSDIDTFSFTDVLAKDFNSKRIKKMEDAVNKSLNKNYDIKFLEGDNFFFKTGSVIYKIENINKKNSLQAYSVIEFTLIFPVEKKAQSIWFSCKTITNSLYASGSTTADVKKIETQCR